MVRIRLIFCCFLLLIQTLFHCHAQTALLESPQVYEGDIALLIIEYDSKIPSLYELDTTPLDGEFEVLDIKSRISLVMETENAFNRMQWKIEIMPKHSGNLRIPSLRVGKKSTPALTLEVLRHPPELQASQNVSVEVQTNTQEPYVGQLIHVTVQVMHNIPLLEGKLLNPQIKNARVHRLGKDRRTVTVLDGDETNVLERNFALIVQQPGETTLSSASYRGQINTLPELSNSTLPIQPRRINRNSKVLQLRVRQPPPTYMGNTWLPAIQLNVSGHWDDIPEVLNVGDSLGYTVIIESLGLPADVLPAGLISTTSDEFEIYADQEKRTDRLQGDTLLGRLEQRFVIIVSKPGEIQFPPTRLIWWDITRETERAAQLEGKTLKVTSPVPAPSVLNPDIAPVFSRAWLLINWYWLAVIGIGLLIGWKLLGSISLSERLSTKLRVFATTQHTGNNLRRACLMNDAAAARQALLEWGRGQWPADRITSLYQIENKINSSKLATELCRLDSVLYGGKRQAWQGRSLWQAIVDQQGSLSRGTNPVANGLPELYPR